MDAHFDKLFSPLLKTLSDSSENVARMALQVLARLSNEETNEKENEEESKGTKWNKLVTNLILLFATDRNLLLARGSLIIRQICDFVNPTKIYTTMSKILVKAEVGPSPSFQTLCYHSQTKKKDISFKSLMIRTMNMILLTAPELYNLREQLRNLKQRQGAETSKLFVTIYDAWSHSPASILSLCLLAGLYQHATDLVYQ